jgi:hypothetical protein
MWRSSPPRKISLPTNPSSHPHFRKAISHAAWIVVVVFCGTAGLGQPLATAQILTGRADNARSGTNSSETYLTPANVNSAQFGKLFSYDVDGYVVAQPLYVPQVSIAGQGTRNVVFVATQHDSVYAFDADSGGTGAPLWWTSFINTAQGITTVPIAEQGCARVTAYTEVGIMGTPVIDTSSGTLYVDAKTKEVVSGVTSYHHRLHALDITTGAEKSGWPVDITASVNGASGLVTFSPLPQQQRPGLLLSNGIIYLGYGSNGCDANAQGWVLAYNPANQPQQMQVGVFNSSPGEPWGASVWQAGVGLAGDASGNVFFSTANGVFDENIGGSDYADSVVQLTLGSNGLTVSDFFTPFDQLNMGQHDLDLGSGGDVLLPDQLPPSPAHLLVTIGKTGAIYVVNRDNMGKFDASGNNIVQTITNATIQYFGSPNFWNNFLYFAPSGETPIIVYKLNNDGTLSLSNQTANTIFVDGLPFISANGTTNGVFWVVRNTSGNILAAYDASSLQLLYTTTQNSGRDALGPTVHFASPMVANGKLYAGTQTELAVYGLLPVITVTAGNNQTGVAGSVLPASLQVQVTDPYSGAPISGFTVTFTSSSGGSFSNRNAVTNAQGIASTQYRLPNTAGSITVNASNTISTIASFYERAIAGPPVAIVPASGQNQTGVVGTQLPAPLVFKVQDKFGNGVSGISVSYSDNANGTFSPNPAKTDPHGKASATYLLPSTAGLYTVTATSGSLPPATMKEKAIAGSGNVAGNIISSDKPSARPSTQLRLPVAVASDQFANSSAHVTVSFYDGGAGGTFSTNRPITGANDKPVRPTFPPLVGAVTNTAKTAVASQAVYTGAEP